MCRGGCPQALLAAVLTPNLTTSGAFVQQRLDLQAHSSDGRIQNLRIHHQRAHQHLVLTSQVQLQVSSIVPCVAYLSDPLPTARFRSSVQRLIRLKHLAATSTPGSEPGVDVRRDHPEYNHIAADCQIDVIDYGSDKVDFRQFDNQGFLGFLETSLRRKEDWAKVRWINVKGIDWKIIKALTLVYS